MTLKFNPGYRAWREAFDNEPHHTRREHVEALHAKQRECDKRATILNVIRLLPNDDMVSMQIHRIERSDDGMVIIVK